MKKWIMAAIVAAGLTGVEAKAQPPASPPPPPGPGGPPVVVEGGAYGGAYGGYATPGAGAGYGFTGPNGHLQGTGKFWSRGFFGSPKWSSADNLTRMPTLPVYMAAPWYNYWPYDGHFQTVAPMASGAFYPPPAYTGNPFLTGRYTGYVPGAALQTFPMGTGPKP
jgi:hypothetical protein